MKLMRIIHVTNEGTIPCYNNQIMVETMYDMDMPSSNQKNSPLHCKIDRSFSSMNEGEGEEEEGKIASLQR